MFDCLFVYLSVCVIVDCRLAGWSVDRFSCCSLFACYECFVVFGSSLALCLSMWVVVLFVCLL